MQSTEEKKPGEGLNAAEGGILLDLAKRSIEHALRAKEILPITVADYPPTLQRKGAAFVTLHLDGRLRGCIGSLEAYRPLAIDVVENAAAAAFRDHRFRPLSEEEWPRIHIHLSVLSAPVPLPFASETELLQRLRPGVDGLIIEAHGRRATYLPSVWEQLPDKAMFLRELRHKAGIPDSVSASELRAWIYTAQSIG